MSVHEHRATTPDEPLKVGVVTISTSRSQAEDRSGDLIADRLVGSGHELLDRKWVSDDVEAIRGAIRELRASSAVAIVCTGGTGLSARDVTPEALHSMFTREIPGFGELFRVLSMQEVGSAAMLSRAVVAANHAHWRGVRLSSSGRAPPDQVRQGWGGGVGGPDAALH